MASKREVRLSSNKDWDAWLAIVKAKATGYKVWSLIDPGLPHKPPHLEEPEMPEYEEEKAYSLQELASYKASIHAWRVRHKNWELQHEAFTKLQDYILETVTAKKQPFLRYVEVHPWNFLRTLQAHLAPSDAARKLELEKEYHRLSKGPNTRKSTQGVESWLDDWLLNYTLARQHGIAEVMDIRRAYRDLILAISTHSEVFAGMNREKIYIAITPTDQETVLLDLIERYREYLREREASNKRNIQSHAFSTDQEAPKDSKDYRDPNGKAKETATFNGKEAGPPKCACGERHYFKDCPYYNPAIRPKDWKADPEVHDRISKKMHDNPRFKKAFEKWKEDALALWARNEKSKEKKEKDSNSKDPESSKASDVPPFNLGTWITDKVTSDSNQGNFTNTQRIAGPAGAFSTADFPLFSSVLLDHCSGMHVCNRSMKHRYQKTRDCTDGSELLGGKRPVPIESYGNLTINVDTPQGKGVVTIEDITYAPDFLTNLVAGALLEDKGLNFWPKGLALYRGEEKVVHVKRFGNHYLLEDNTASHAQAADANFAVIKPKNGDVNYWHQLMAHAGDKAFQHLPTATEGVRITDIGNRVLKTNECETCALTKSHRIVLRSSHISENSEKPFHRITLDLIQVTPGLNRHE